MNTSKHKRSHWDSSTISSQSGKISIITGANSGIGYATALQLAAHGSHVILACRNEDRALRAFNRIQSFVNDHCLETERGTVEFMLVDLSSLDSVRAFVKEFRERFDRLDLLINNAGIVKPRQSTTVDGIPTQFEVNYLAHFYLTASLFSLLRASPASRIVNVSSLAHRHAKFNVQTRIQTGELYFTYELQRRLDAAKIKNVISVAAHPGVTYTEGMEKVIVQTLPTFLHHTALWILSWVPFQSAEMGALPSLYAATAEDIKGGEFIGPHAMKGYWGYPVRESSVGTSRDEVKGRQLWELSEKLTKTAFNVV